MNQEVLEFQLQVAEKWIDQASKLQPGSPHFEFVAYFAALNALYWLWAFADGSEGGKELDQLFKLIGKLDRRAAEAILEDRDVKHSIAYFCERQPIRDMRHRRKGAAGDDGRGLGFKGLLCTGRPLERLQGLAGVLYLVRCNLVHGSKDFDGLDRTLLERSISPVRRIAIAAKEMTAKAAQDPKKMRR